MGKIREFLNIWLNPKKGTTLEEAFKKYNISPEAADLLLRTANGVAYTDYSRYEGIKGEKSKKKPKIKEREEEYSIEEYSTEEVMESIGRSVQEFQQDGHNLERE